MLLGSIFLYEVASISLPINPFVPSLMDASLGTFLATCNGLFAASLSGQVCAGTLAKTLANRPGRSSCSEFSFAIDGVPI